MNITKTTSEKTKSSNPYEISFFAEHGHKLIDELSSYLEKAIAGESSQAVLPWANPETNVEKWGSIFDEALRKDGGHDLSELLKEFLDHSNHLQDPRYMGHQVSPSSPTAALANLVSSILNNGETIYEMGPSAVAMENVLVSWMAKLLGYDTSKSSGIFTSGGSLGNLTALLAARQAKAGYDIWNEGNKDSKKLAIICSEESHYCVDRAVKIMGLGRDAIITVPVDERHRFDPSHLPSALEKAKSENKTVIAVVANACSTATGSYDPLDKIADFCEENDIWLHIDGAHGASIALSKKYKHFLKGIERADSVVWDAHKMMLVPSLCTAVIYKNAESSYEAFNQKASYLFGGKSPEEEWFNPCHRTLECTKNTMAVRLFTSIAVHGTNYYENYLDDMFDLARSFAELLKNTEDFELYQDPDSNIVCFRYLKGKSAEIRRKIIDSGEFYLVQADLKDESGDKTWLRVTLINPHTDISHLERLLEKIREI